MYPGSVFCILCGDGDNYDRVISPLHPIGLLKEHGAGGIILLKGA